MQKVIHLNDYDGMLKSLFTEGLVVDKEQFIEQYKESFTKDSPKEVYAHKLAPESFGFDLEYTLRNLAGDHDTEDLEQFLDFNSPLLEEAQKLIDKWLKEQDGAGDLYNVDEDYIIDITDLYNECMEEQHG